MGQIFSRFNNPLNNNNAVEENEIVQNYRYPPKSGEKEKYKYLWTYVKNNELFL